MDRSEQSLAEELLARLERVEACLARLEAFNAVVLEAAAPWLKTGKGKVWLALLASKGGKW